MQPTGGSSGEHSRGNLQRFASAPATWLEALLESDIENNNIILEPAPVATSSFSPRKVPTLPPTHPPPPRTPPGCGISRQASADLSFLDAGGGEGSGVGISGFLRQSSSPAEFLSVVNSEGYFSGFGGPGPGNMEYLLNSTGVAPALGNKRARHGDLGSSTPKLSSAPMKVEQSMELQGDIVGLLDAEMDKLTEDAVLCRVRAKRGCATHPRSIAERVRRTRISDRIRKLQELVPNMDKQTNTADMLDEAVEYVKFLQKQIQELTEHQKRCICSMKE